MLTNKEIDDIHLIIDKSRIKLMQSELSFFGHILLQLNQEYQGQNFGVETVAVSVDTIYYNFNFLHNNVDDTNDMMFIYMHEIMHLVLDHLNKNRINDKDMKIWNAAGDHVINLDLFASGFNYSKKNNILCDRRFRGMSTEEVYDILIKDPPSKMNNWNDVMPSDGDEEIASVKDMVVNAYNSHVLSNGNADNIPGIVREYIEEIKNPILPWPSLLRKYITEITKNDLSWNKLNLYFLPDFYIPGFQDNSMSKIDFAIDVSGSIDKNTFDIFINEIKNILIMSNITKIGIYQFSTTTLSYDVVSNLDELNNIKFNGGGGTCIKHTLREAARSDAVAIFIITDGYMDLHLEPLYKPTVWCVYNNKRFKEPFGSSVIFNHTK